MKVSFLSSLVLFFLSLSWRSCVGEIIYVSSSTGSSDNDGKSQSAPLLDIQIAIDLVKDSIGSSVLLKRGDSWDVLSGINFRPSWDSGEFGFGNRTNEFVLGAYGEGDRPVLLANERSSGIINIRSTGPMETPTISQYITVRDLVLSTTVDHTIEGGITGFYCIDSYYGNPHHITVDNVMIRGTSHGLTDYCNDFTLKNSQIIDNHNFGSHSGGHSQGVYINAENVNIIGNDFERNGKWNSWFDHSMYISACKNVLIQNNLVHNAFDGIKIRKGSNIKVVGNLFEGLGLGGSSCGGDDSGEVRSVLYERNVFVNTHDSLNIREQSGGGFGAFEIVARYNLFFERMVGSPGGNHGSLAHIGSDTIDGIHWHNNLFYDILMEHDFLLSNSNPENVLIQNNLHYKTNDSYLYVNNAVSMVISDVSDRLTVSHNMYYVPPNSSYDIWTIDGTDFSDLDSLHTSYPSLEVNSLVGDPFFVNAPARDWTLQSGSPAINAGAPFPSSFGFPTPSTDFWGNPLIGTPDIGPFEHQPNGISLQACDALGGFLCTSDAPVCPINFYFPNAVEGTDSCCFIPCVVSWEPGVVRDCGHGCEGQDPADTNSRSPWWGAASPHSYSPILLIFAIKV